MYIFFSSNSVYIFDLFLARIGLGFIVEIFEDKAQERTFLFQKVQVKKKGRNGKRELHKMPEIQRKRLQPTRKKVRLVSFFFICGLETGQYFFFNYYYMI
jgi:hypothetical protein